MAHSDTLLDDTLHWYKDAIIYELHIKAFRDGNGDGIGDFQGLLEKLDYLQELGVTAIWVLPFYPSPLRDDGYDIADYYSINPSYGTIEQFRQFLDEAHQRNLKVITELVINHSSDQHPWFQRARKAPKGSPERDYYVWTDNPDQYRDVRIIFQDFETSNWTWDPVAQQYYWHRFFHHQPDLNYDNPLVQDEVFKLMDYWCAMGVDGFRLDAVPYLFEREGTNGENLPETHAFLKKLRKHVDDHFPGVVFLAEANMWPEDSASYFGDGDECHMNYHFPVMPRMFMALQMENRYPITDIFDQTPAIPDTCQWAIFLRNHDELTLEMVTDEERDFMYKTYAKDPKARINLGIRHRLAPLMENNRRKIELLNSLLFSLPGTPVLYYGDEIGMGDNVYLGDRDGVRTPMQWSPDRNAGFSNTNPQQLYLPTIQDPEYNYGAVNVETQRRNRSSLFWFTKRMINLRKKFKAFGRGDLRFLNVENAKVLAFTRTYEAETLLIVVNLSKFAQPAEVDLSDFAGYVPVETFSKNPFPAIPDSGLYPFTLAPHDYQWFVLENTRTDASNLAALPQLTVGDWANLLHGRTRETLETVVLPAYLARMDWFGGKEQTVQSMTISDSSPIPVGAGQGYVLLIEVGYERGLPETYQLTVAFVTGAAADKLTENCPQSVLAQLTVGTETGILCDGLYTTELQQTLLSLIAGANTATGSRLVFSGNPALTAYVTGNESIKPKLVTSGRAYTSLSYDNRYGLKLYRKVDGSLNPDSEITRYLTETVPFANVPAFAGSIDLQTGREALTLGLLTELAENATDLRSFMQERVTNFLERLLARNTDAPDDLLLYPNHTLTQPVPYDSLPEALQTMLGGQASAKARQLGVCIGEMHRALAAGTTSGFVPEAFSLHYQRSLFAGFQSLIRESFQSLKRALKRLPDQFTADAELVLNGKSELQNTLKRIYADKLDATKIRVHGNLTFDKILFTGKDLIVQDFGGDPNRSYSERRLKRSPLRDVADVILAFYYAAYDGFTKTTQLPQDEAIRLLPFAGGWAQYMSGFFMDAYLTTVGESTFIPQQPADRQMMLDTFLLEKALIDLGNKPDQARVPLQVIRSFGSIG